MADSEIKKSLESFAHKIKNHVHATAINLEVLKAKLEKQGVEKSTLKYLDLVSTEVQKINAIAQKYVGFWELSEAARKKKI